MKNGDGTGTPVPGIRVDKTFTAPSPLCRETVEIPFDASPYADRSLVVFEELRDTETDTLLAEHKSLRDAAQTVTYRPAPVSSLVIVKDEISSPANGIAYIPGETVNYRITVTNTGETDLHAVRVTDARTGLNEVIPFLASGDSREFFTSHTVTEEDAQQDTYDNIAVAEAEDPTAPGATLRAEDPETVPVMTYDPGYLQDKQVLNSPANGIAFVPGETVRYRLTLQNTGNQPLTITVRDDLVGLTETVDLPVGGEWEKTVSYTVTEADAQRGSVLNVLSSEGRTPGRPEDPIVPPPVEVEVPTVLTGTVTVIYVDEDGAVLIGRTVVLQDVPVGTAYRTVQKTIQSYEFVRMGEGSAPREGTVAAGVQEVIYVYKKTAEPVTPVTPVTPPVTPVPPMGDTVSLGLYAAVFLAGLGGLFLLLPRRKRRTPC